MSFPTGEMVAAFGKFLYFESLKSTFIERHPDMADRVESGSSPAFHLKVGLSGGRSVVLSHMRFTYRVAWAIVDPALHSDPAVWPLDTPVEILADALHARASAYISGTPMPSPWCWNESEASDVTRLADLRTSS